MFENLGVPSEAFSDTPDTSCVLAEQAVHDGETGRTMPDTPTFAGAAIAGSLFRRAFRKFRRFA